MNHYNIPTQISLEQIKEQERKMYLLASKIKPIDKYIEFRLKEIIDKKLISSIEFIRDKYFNICTIELLGNYWYEGIFQNFKMKIE